MARLQDRIKFAEKHCVSKEGRHWRSDFTPWIIPHYWKPVDGYRLAANNVEHLCDGCKDRAGELVPEWDWSLEERFKRHKKKLTPPEAITNPEDRAKFFCQSLALQPILTTVLNLPRRDGKTFNTAVWILSTSTHQRNRSVLFVAAAGDQTKRIFEDNFIRVIGNNPRLKQVCEKRGDSIFVTSTKSMMRIVPTSFRSITGGGYSHIIIDEARDVHPRVVAAAILSGRDQNGAECPRGHVQIADIDPEKVGKKRCPHCNDRLIPWYPRIIITSSSGIISDTEWDWFEELVSHLEENGHPNAHLYRTHHSSNKAVSAKVTEALGGIFGVVPGLATYMDVELTNRARRLGEDFITEQEIRRITRHKLQNLRGDDRPCVAFLDTSWSSDTTSLYIFADKFAGEEQEPWHTMTGVHLKKWKPIEMPKGHIDPDMVQEHLDEVMLAFPNIELLLVDDRGMEWAKETVIFCNKKRPWGKKVFLFHGKGPKSKKRHRGQRLEGVYGGAEDRSTGWQLFEYRVGYDTIELHDDDDVKKELRGVRRRPLPDGGYEIVDRNRKKRHADIIESAAGCCFCVHILQTKPKGKSLKDLNQLGDNVLARIWRPKTADLTLKSF